MQSSIQILWRPFTVILMIFISSLLSGCFSNQPSEEEIKSMVAERFDRDFSGIFTTSNVVKDNGYKQNDTHYVAEVTITGTAQQSLDDYARQIMKDNTLTSLEKITASMTIGLLKLTMPEFEAGDQIEFKRNYLFIDTDKGWILKWELNPDGQPIDEQI